MPHLRLLARDRVDYRLVLSLATLFFLGWMILPLLGWNLTEQQRIIDIASKLTTLTAVTVGGIWSYYRFIRHREDQPILSVGIGYEKLRLPDGGWLLKVAAKITNGGHIDVHLHYWQLRAELLLPLSTSVAEFLRRRSGFTEHEAPWPTIAGDPTTFFGRPAFMGLLLEPGESDFVVGNLVIPAGVETAQIYCEFKHDLADEFGWVAQQVVTLEDEEIVNG
jgi:hypothetical protein